MEIVDILQWIDSARKCIESLNRDEKIDYDKTYKKLAPFSFPIINMSNKYMIYLIWDCVNKPCTKEEYDKILNEFKARSAKRTETLEIFTNKYFGDTGLISPEDYYDGSIDTLGALDVVEHFLKKFM